MRHKIVALVVVLGASLAIAATALAGSGGSIVAGYGGVAGQVNTQVKSAKPSSGSRTPATAAAPQRSTLPFTGFDIAIAIGGGVLLLLVGAGLRRTTRKTH